MRLQAPGDVRVARDEGTEPDAAGREALRERVDDDDLVLESREREGADGLAAVVEKLPVDLVGDEEEAVVAAELRRAHDLLLRVDGPGRIVRIAEEDETGLRRQRLLPLGARRKVEAVLAARDDRAQA